MSDRIRKAFKKKEKKLVTFTTGGDPDLDTSLEILNTIISNGIDIIEIGMPFSDPMADGPIIQESSVRSIANGTKINDILETVNKVRKLNNEIPIILMGYYNSIFNMGVKTFASKCADAGVDGLIIVDLPWPDNKNFSKKCKKANITFVQLLSPTTSKKRMKKIINDSHDMIYYISMLSTTGGKLKVSPKKILEKYKSIKKINRSKNVVIGFGITEKTISSLKKADGLVVGSALCKKISESLQKRQNPVTNVVSMVSRLKNKIS